MAQRELEPQWEDEHEPSAADLGLDDDPVLKAVNLLNSAMQSLRAHQQPLEPQKISKLEKKNKPAVPIRLPIKDHEKRICRHVAMHRVTIIHGETGCGKSSAVPLMLQKSYDAAHGAGTAKMFVTQPRRLAARALFERVRLEAVAGSSSPRPPKSRQASQPGLIGLRLGHGDRSKDSHATRIWFATTGCGINAAS